MFNIKSVVSKITGRDSQPNSPGRLTGSSSVSEEDGAAGSSNFHSAEGFICPKCMKAMPSPEELQNHYRTIHSGDDDSTSPDSPASSSSAGFLGLHQEVGEHYKLRQNGSSVNQDRLLAEIQGITDIGELRKSLLDALESRAGLQLEKEGLEQRTAQLARVNAAMQTNADEAQITQAATNERLKILEVQIAHRDSVDDAALLREQIVFVQRAMDNMTQERECEVVALRAELARSRDKDALALVETSEKMREEIAAGNAQLELARKEVKTLSSEKDKVQLQLQELQEAHKSDLQTIKALESSRVEEIASAKLKHQAIVAELNSVLKNTTSQYQRECAKIEDLQKQYVSKVQDLENQLEMHNKNLLDATDKLGKSSQEVAQCRAKIADYEKKIVKLEEKNANQLQQLMAAISEKDSKISKLNTDASKLNELIGSEGASKAVIEQLTEQIESLKKEVKQRFEQDAMSTAQIDVLNEHLGEKKLQMEASFIQICGLNELLEESKRECKKLMTELNKISSKNEMLTAELDMSKVDMQAAKDLCDEYKSCSITSEKKVQQLEFDLKRTLVQNEEFRFQLDKSKDVIGQKEAMILDLQMASQAQGEEYVTLEIQLTHVSNQAKLFEDQLRLADEEIQAMEIKKASLETGLFEYEKKLVERDVYKRDMQRKFEGDVKALLGEVEVLTTEMNKQRSSYQDKLSEQENKLKEQEKRMEDEAAAASDMRRADTMEIESLKNTLAELRELLQVRVVELNEAKSLIVSNEVIRSTLEKASREEIESLTEQKQKLVTELEKQEERNMMLENDLLKSNQILLDSKKNADSNILKLDEIIFELKNEAILQVQKMESQASQLVNVQNILEQKSIEQEQFQKETQDTINNLKKSHESELAKAVEKTAEQREKIVKLESMLVDVEKKMENIKAVSDAVLLQKDEMQKKISLLEASNKELVAERTANREQLAAQAETISASDQKYAKLNASFDEIAGDKLALDAHLATSQAEHKSLIERYYSSCTENDGHRRTIDDLRRRAEDSQSALLEMGRENQILRMELEKNSGRKWTEDADVTDCPTCRKEFTLMTRKHHCRNCGQIFCNECSSKLAAVGNNKKPVRVCESCFNELAPSQ